MERYTYSGTLRPARNPGSVGNTITIAREQLNNFGSPTGNITQIRSPNGRWIEFTHDVSNRITRAQDNIGRAVTYEYDTSGHLFTVTDQEGSVTEYQYDTLGRMLAIRNSLGVVFLANEYDERGKVIKQTMADGSTYQFAYVIDDNGKVTQTIVTGPGGDNRE